MTESCTDHAQRLAPAAQVYKGSVSRPERWARFDPRPGDVIICSPPKCGTTWLQTIVSMLIAGVPAVTEQLSVVSPWVDAVFTTDEMLDALKSRPGRRVLKTHTPVDGFPAWSGVTILAIFRHPLDVFLSLRDHVANLRDAEAHPIGGEVSAAFDHFLYGSFHPDRVDERSLGSLVQHYQAATSGHQPLLGLVHYADLIHNPSAALARLAKILGVDCDTSTLEQIKAATTFDAMKANATRLTPMSGTLHWRDDAAFFSSGGIRRRAEILSYEQIHAYHTRLAALVPDIAQRRWLQDGESPPSTKI